MACETGKILHVSKEVENAYGKLSFAFKMRRDVTESLITMNLVNAHALNIWFPIDICAMNSSSDNSTRKSSL